MKLSQSVARWTGWAGDGLDHCLLSRESGGLCLQGLVIGGADARTCAAHYRVQTDESLRTREVVLSFIGGHELRLAADGKGHWTNAVTQDALAWLEGCLDVDIAATPATNTLPILRMGLAVGESADILACYLPMPDHFGAPIAPVPARQRYTRLADGGYGYASLTSSFATEFDLDENGLVKDYPDVFRRVL
jgi:uncharacterized protein